MNNKVIKNGKTAVVIASSEYGWGFDIATCEHIRFDPKLIEMIENRKMDELDDKWFKTNFINCLKQNDYFDHSELEIVWINIGTKFKVVDMNRDGGKEKVVTDEGMNLIA